MGFVKVLRDFSDYCAKGRLRVDTATVAVTEKYARRVLKVKKDQPLEFRGIKLRCVGSRRWQLNQGEGK